MGAALPCLKTQSLEENSSGISLRAEPSTFHTSRIIAKSMPSESLKYRKLNGFDQFKEFCKNIKDKDLMFFYFTGSKNEQGVSWCSDCVKAEPFVMAAAEKYVQNESNFVIVDVGDRKFWKDQNNLFRLTKPFVSVIPTLVRWNAPQRLEGSHCNDNDLLEMFFTDEI